VLKWQCLKARMAGTETVTCEVAAWEKRRNLDLVTIDWRFAAADVHIKPKHLYAVAREQAN